MAARKKASRKKAARRRTPRKKGTRKKQAARARQPGSMAAERRAREGGGKPEVVIDAEALRILSKRLVPHSEMAALLEISETTLETKIAESDELRLAIKAGLAEIKDSLRTTQLSVALGSQPKVVDGVSIPGTQPNPTMLIWLGKVVLGQQETVAFGGGDDEGMDLTAVLTLKIDELIKRGARERQRSAAQREPSGG